MDSQHARLIVSRQDETDAKQRQVYVSLGDQQIAYLMFGDSVTRSLAPGKYILKANNTLVWKSVEFEAKPGDEVRFSIVNYTGKGFALLLTLFGVSLLFLKIERV